MLIIVAELPFVSIFITYVQTGLVPRIPTLIVSGFIAMAAIQSLFSGFILQTIYQKNRQDFEMDLHKYGNKDN